MSSFNGLGGLFDAERSAIAGRGACESEPRAEAATAPAVVRWQAEPPERDLAGLALSGGGIRSATFNLGLLQGLARQGVLEVFDYLATVSGGGYVGAFWSAWRSRKPRSESFPTGKDGVEAPEVRHLRIFGNFLRPRLQLLSFETGRFVTAIFAGLLPSVSATVAFVALVLLAWLALAWALAAGADTGRIADAAPAAAVFFFLSLSVQAAFEAVWQGRRREEQAARAESWYWAVAFGSSLVGGLLWWLVWHALPVPASGLLAPSGVDGLELVAVELLAPAAVWSLLVVVLVAARTIVSRAENTVRTRPLLGAVDRVMSRWLVCAGAWAVASAAWIVGQLVAAEGWSLLTFVGTAGAGAGSFAWARRLLLAIPSVSAPAKTSQALVAPLLKALAFVTLLASGAVVAALLAMIGGKWGSQGLWLSLAAAVVSLLLVLFLFDPHGISFHSFYRARLVRTYLGASNEVCRNGEAAECTGDDVELTELPAGKPFHLICCAANDLGGDPLHKLHRGAESAVASTLGLQVGHRWRRWSRAASNGSKRPVMPWEPTLGAVMTASGAAVNNHMGMISMRLGRSVTFLMTALNLRLGRWVEGASESSESWWNRFPRWLPGFLFFRELLGSSREDGRCVFLSDGAHFDNLGLYELVRRHCRYILVADCGADTTVAFDDLGNAVRRVREDFGVEIELDTRPLTPGPDRRARQPMVAGEVRYPSGDAGILLYVKPTLTGREPSDVAQYAGRNTTFPHETTLDQFFDEAQWESYRRLGEHVAELALDGLLDSARSMGGIKRSGRELFVQAHMAWRSSPLGDPAAVDRFREDWAELEALLLDDSAAEHLWDEIYDPTEDGTAAPPAAADKSARLAELRYVRRAFLHMEDTFLHTGFGAEPTHRDHIGWLNLFNRWASTPALRAWWPWLEPFHSRAFVRFAEESLGLPGRDELDPTVEALSSSPAGYAWSRWPRSGQQVPEGCDRLGFYLKWSGRRLLAGLVEFRATETEVSWKAGDFFIPPGLWGIGLGDLFLRKLVEYLAKQDVKAIEVCSTGTPSRSEIVLYSSLGFHWKTFEGSPRPTSFVLRLAKDGADGPSRR